MKKRALSLILALVMCLGLLPMTALAAPGERPPTDPYSDHIDDLAEAAEKGYVLSFSEGEDGPIDLGSGQFGSADLPAKTITMTNQGDKSLYLVTTGFYGVSVTLEGSEYKKQYNLNFSNVPVYELEPDHTYHLNIRALPNMDATSHKASFSLDFSYTYPANHSAMQAWDLTCRFDVTYTITSEGVETPITIDRNALNFEDMEPYTTQDQTITVTNISNHEIGLWGTYSGNSYGPLSVNGTSSVGLGDDLILAPGERTTLIMTANPSDSEINQTFSLKWQYQENGGWVSGGFEIPVHVRIKSTTNDPADVDQPTTPTQPEQPVTPAGKTASPTNDKLTVDGAVAVPAAYKIEGSNYFKIRDMAALLNGTSAQFSVGHDNAAKSVTLTTGEGYEKQANDLTGVPTGGNQTAISSNDAIYINGVKAELTVYKIGGSNYVKLRDLGKALGFSVDWSKEAGMMIDTSKPYSE